MKHPYLLPLSLFIAPATMAQVEYLSPTYIEAVSKDLAAMNQTPIAKSIAVSRSAGIATPSQVTITEINAHSFPTVSGFFSVRDSEGEHVSGLTSSDLALAITHPALTERQTPLDIFVSEIGSTSTKADIAFVIDSTGSMSGEINTVIANIREFVDALAAADIDYRLAGFSFGDEVPYRKKISFTNNADAFKNWVSSLVAHGGSDWPENPLDSIISAGSELSWRADAQQIIMLITDAPAHVAGDGGDSDTTATFSLAALSTQQQAVYYSSPESQYLSLGTSLNWPFNGDVLLSQLGDAVRSSYQFSFTDPVGLHDGLTRQMIVHPNGQPLIRDQAPYTPDLKTGRFPLVVMNNDPEPRAIASAQVTVTDKDGNSTTYISDGTGTVDIELTGDQTYQITAELTGFYAPQEMTVTTTVNDSGDIDISVEELSFNLALLTVAEIKASVSKRLNRIKAFGPALISNAPFEAEANTALNWISTIPDHSDELGDGPSDAQQEGLKRMDIATQAVHKSNQYIENDVKIIGGSLAKIVMTFLDLNSTFTKIEEQLRTVAGKLDPAAADWAIIRWTYSQVKELLEITASSLGQLTKNLSNLLLDVVKMNLEEQHHGLVTELKTLLAVATTNPNLPLIENMAQQAALDLLIPIYANGADTKFEKSIGVHSNITTSLTADALAYRLNQANQSLNQMLKQAEAVKSTLANTSKLSDIIGVIGGAVSSIDSTLDILPASIANTIPALATVKTALSALDKGLKVGDITVSATNSAVASSHFLVLDSQIENVIERTSDGADSSISPYRAMSRTSFAFADKKLEQLNTQLTTKSIPVTSATLDEHFIQANQLLSDGKLDAFFDYYINSLTPAVDNDQQNISAMMAYIISADQLERQYGRPGNWDALRTDALTAAINLKIQAISNKLAIAATLLELGTSDSAQEKALTAQLSEALTHWQTESTILTAKVAEARLRADGFTSNEGLFTIDKVNVSSQPENGHTLFTVTVSLENIGDTNANAVTPSIVANTLTFISHSAQDSSTDYANGESYQHTFVYSNENNPELDKHSLDITLTQNFTNEVVTDNKVVFAYLPTIDSDKDGIPDHIENQYGFDPQDATDGYKDHDNDGVNSSTEYQLGLDPLKDFSTGSDKADFDVYLSMLIPGNGLAGDVNQDATVDTLDYDHLVEMYGQSTQANPKLILGDFNRNGKIDLFDLTIVKKSM